LLRPLNARVTRRIDVERSFAVHDKIRFTITIEVAWSRFIVWLTPWKSNRVSSISLSSCDLPSLNVVEIGITTQTRNPLGSRWTEDGEIAESIAVEINLNWNVTR
jgi:hypothetical protein